MHEASSALKCGVQSICIIYIIDHRSFHSSPSSPSSPITHSTDHHIRLQAFPPQKITKKTMVIRQLLLWRALLLLGIFALLISSIASSTAFILRRGRRFGFSSTSCPHRRTRTHHDGTAKTSTTVLSMAAAKRTANKKKNQKKKVTAASSSKKAAGGIAGGFGKASSGEWGGCEPLRKWLLEKGSVIDPALSVCVVDPNTGLRGVRAISEIKRGDVIISIPRETCILDENKADNSLMANEIYPTEAERKALPPPIRVALLLLWLERVPSERDAWKPLLGALPTPADFVADGGPMQLWSDEELAEVECCQLIADVRRRKVELREHYEKRILPRWTDAAARADGPMGGVEPPSYEAFQHAVCVVTSRNYGQGEPDAGSSSMLVPAVDLLNHDDPTLVNTNHALSPCEIDPPQGRVVVMARKNIKKNEEVTLSYGALPNRLLLAQFGFLLCNRETPLISDTAVVRIDSLLHRRDSKEDKESARMEGEKSTTISVEAEEAADAEWEDGPGPIKFINLKGIRGSSGRLSRWQPASVARAAADFIASSNAGSDDSDDDIAAAGRELYRGLLEKELAAYTTTLEEDEDRLAHIKDMPIPIRSEWALRFRIESKRLLQKELESL